MKTRSLITSVTKFVTGLTCLGEPREVLSRTPAPLRTHARRFALSSAGALGATLFFFQRAVFSNEIFIARDIWRVYYPLRHYWVSRVSQGEFPDWYPYDGLGQSFPAMIISGAFHPSNLLYLLMPLGTALKWNVLLCFPAALWGMYLLARACSLERWEAALAALVFGFSGYTVSITNNLLYLMAVATVPWVLWAAARLREAPSVPRGVATAALLALLVASGDSQSFVMCAGLVVLWGLAAGNRRAALASVAAVAAAAPLAAVQLLPPLLLSSSFGISRQPLATVLTWSMHPLRFFDIAFGPLFHGDETSGTLMRINQELLHTVLSTRWVDSLFIGLPALTLAGVGVWAHRRSRRTWWACAFAAVLLWLTLGRFGGLYGVLFQAVPLWRPFRYPEKIFPYLLLFVSLAAGFGLRALVASAPLKRKTALVSGGLALLCFGLVGLEAGAGVFSRHLVTWLWSSATPEAQSFLSQRFEQTCGLSGVFAALFAALSGVMKEPVRFAPAMVGLCFVQFFAANEPLYQLTRPQVLHEPTGFVQDVLAMEGTPRLGRFRVFGGVDEFNALQAPGMTPVDFTAISSSVGMDAVTPALWDIEGANAYLPGSTYRVHAVNDRSPNYFLRMLPYLNTRYVTLSRSFFERWHGAPDLVVDEQRQFGVLLLRNPGARARAYLSRPHCVASFEEAMKLLNEADFKLAEETVVECAQPLESGGEGALGKATVVADAPERVAVDVDANSPALLVLSDAYYEGWRALLDGREVDILPANGAVRGVPVSAGHHELVFSYRTPGLVPGAIVSAISWALAAAIALSAWWGRRRRSSHGAERGK